MSKMRLGFPISCNTAAQAAAASGSCFLFKAAATRYKLKAAAALTTGGPAPAIRAYPQAAIMPTKGLTTWPPGRDLPRYHTHPVTNPTWSPETESRWACPVRRKARSRSSSNPVSSPKAIAATSPWCLGGKRPSQTPTKRCRRLSAPWASRSRTAEIQDKGPGGSTVRTRGWSDSRS